MKGKRGVCSVWIRNRWGPFFKLTSIEKKIETLSSPFFESDPQTVTDGRCFQARNPFRVDSPIKNRLASRFVEQCLELADSTLNFDQPPVILWLHAMHSPSPFLRHSRPNGLSRFQPLSQVEKKIGKFQICPGLFWFDGGLSLFCKGLLIYLFGAVFFSWNERILWMIRSHHFIPSSLIMLA